MEVMPRFAVAELTLDDYQRHAFTRHLDGVGVPELVRREAPADTCCGLSGAGPLGPRRLTRVGRAWHR
jgi:hypothetical protein